MKKYHAKHLNYFKNYLVKKLEIVNMLNKLLLQNR